MVGCAYRFSQVSMSQPLVFGRLADGLDRLPAGNDRLLDVGHCFLGIVAEEAFDGSQRMAFHRQPQLFSACFAESGGFGHELLFAGVEISQQLLVSLACGQVCFVLAVKTAHSAPATDG